LPTKDAEKQIRKGVGDLGTTGNPVTAPALALAKLGRLAQQQGGKLHRKIAARFPALHDAHRTVTRKAKLTARKLTRR
jgi:hypothetical protein